MDHFNLAAICGTVSSDPRERQLPSGSRVVNLEVTVRLDDGTKSVPVVVHDRTIEVAAGDEIVVTGRIARRFFRVGGTTQSRTELVATSITPAHRKRTVQRALASALDDLPR